ncbi:amidohydrolase family protein [Marasmitruncus massiliensis]|uniref:amidohydrolase family protein n=1 Tax=Marasmitruncus massiliensis TaxID=1944642 RepID=UPI0015E129C0|nr:amidohydrolase family protein [Marasmitruncus massiliensis]
MTEINGRKRMIADAHAHIFPQKIAEKATQSIGSFYDIKMLHTGTSHLLLESGQKIGVSRYLVSSTATKPEQVEAINTFVAEECRIHPEFFGFGTMHPDYRNIEEEVGRIVALGLHGVKLHPDFQRFNIDDPDVMPMYRAIEKAGLPILFHTGDKRMDFSAPRRLHEVAVKLPGLTCIAAHFGGYNSWSEGARHLLLPNVYFDTSSSLFALTRDQAVGLLYHFGVDRFMFGTDFPMWDHREELDRFLALGLSDTENDQILYQNFARIFQIQL